MIPCEVVEVAKDSNVCEDRGRLTLDPSVSLAVLQNMEKNGYCGGDVAIDCAESFFSCGLVQLEGGLRDTCVNDAADAADAAVFTSPGFCYIDDPQSPLVADCDATEKRQLRAVGADVPTAGSLIFLACAGE
jgi:hypothetical protein